MNCREAKTQILAERDGALAHGERAALVSHVATCSDCRQVQERLVAAFVHWKTSTHTAALPDPEREWHAVRRKIRGGAEAGEIRLSPQRPGWLTWLTMPVATAGVAALALFISLPDSPAPDKSAAAPTPFARAESVEAPGQNASTMVYVDDKSGWLIVWASDAAPKRG